VIAKFNVLDKISASDYDTGTFMATNERKLGWLDGISIISTEYGDCAYQRPVAVYSMEIGMADARVLDVDQNLIGTGLLDWDLLVLNWTAGLLNDLRPLLLGNVAHGGRGGRMCCSVGGWNVVDVLVSRKTRGLYTYWQGSESLIP
jgi:hypothetical protein